MRKPLMQLPAKGDPYFNNYIKGGINPCIVGNLPKLADYRSGADGYNVLPNCVGWAVGEFNRIGDAGECKYLGSVNAVDLIRLAEKQGLSVGSEPKVGAAIVWAGGSGAGHVGIVAQVIDLETIVISESGWSSSRPMWTAKHYKANGNWTEGDDASWMRGKYVFKGFIYNPYMEEAEMDYEIFKEYMQRYEAERAALPPSKWAEPALEDMKAQHIINGDADGNIRPRSYVTREEVAVMLSNALTEDCD